MTEAHRRILVVDDEPMILEVVRAYLEREGYAVTTAENGESALALEARLRPDLVVLDLMLHDLSGEEVCRAIRL
ncbi:MAG: response regulator, partial [Bacillota bacterium]